MKKKILFVINTLGRAGAETALITLLKKLPENEYDISLYFNADLCILRIICDFPNIFLPIVHKKGSSSLPFLNNHWRSP